MRNFINALYAAAELTDIHKSEVEFTEPILAARLEGIDPNIYVFLDEFREALSAALWSRARPSA